MRLVLRSLDRHRAHIEVALHRACRQTVANDSAGARNGHLSRVRADSCNAAAVETDEQRRTVRGFARMRLARLWLKRPRGGRDARNEDQEVEAGRERAGACSRAERPSRHARSRRRRRKPRAATSALTPPEVTKFVDAKRPEGTPPEGAAVDSELTIAADGKLTDAKVVASAGAELDAAALEAVRQFTFEPARKGDRAIPARIRYRYTFEPARRCPARRQRRRRRGADAPRRAGAAGAARRPSRGPHPVARRRQARRRRDGRADVRRRAPPSPRRWPPRTAPSRSPTSRPATTASASTPKASPPSTHPKR